MKRYQLGRFNLWESQILVPTIRGTRKFPSTAGIEGIRKRKTMMMPCMLKNLL